MEYYLSLLTFTLVTCITPGPNNLMLLASGLNHGVKSSLPHYFGISIGFFTLVLMVAFGLGSFLKAFPGLFSVMKWLGASYLIFLAWKIARSGSSDVSAAIKKPLTFIQAAAFQYVNPKTWVMAIAAITTFSRDSKVGSAAVIVAAFLVTGLFSQGVWLLSGQGLQGILRMEKSVNVFNYVIGTLLILSVIPMVL